MRDIEDMKRIESLMRHGEVIEIRRHATGRNYVLTTGEKLRGQIVRDMEADGWIVQGDSSYRLATRSPHP